VAEARHPAFAVRRRGAQHRVGKASEAERLHLRAVELLAAEIFRIGRVRIDDDGVDARASKHCGRERAGQAATGNDNVGIAHCHSPLFLP